MRPPRPHRPVPVARAPVVAAHRAHTLSSHTIASPPAPRVSAAAKRARRRAAKAAAGGLPPPPDEADRRRKQVALRALALKVRGQGEQYNKWKARRAVENGRAAVAKKVAKRDRDSTGGGAAAGPGSAAAGAHGRAKPATPAAPRASTVDALVLPIFWNRRPDEKSAVLDAAREAAGVLRAAGLNVGVDDDDATSPGQKMGAADAAGVRVRVEIGPRDVGPGTASVAVSAGVGGGVAPRTPVADRGAALVAAVLKALGRGGEVAEAAAAPAPKRAKQAKKAAAAPTPAAAEPAPSPAPPPAPAPSHPTTGEGLDDDFGDALLAGVESEGEGTRKKKKKKAAAKADAAPAPAPAPAKRRVREVPF